MRISDWSSDVCSSDLLPEAQCFGVEGELEEALAVVGGHMAGGLGGGDMMPAKALPLQERRKPRAILLDAQGVGGHGRRLGWLHQPSILHIRSEEHTSELQSLMRISYAVFCLKKKH